VEQHRVVSEDAWVAARTALLAKEKEFTHLRDQLSQQRRDLPWRAVAKDYTFEGPNGRQTLRDLFDGRSQLVVYHFMFDPSWDAGCEHCSFWADSFDGGIVHLNQRDVSMLAVSRAPYDKIAAYRQRMGWSFTWLSSSDSDFTRDFHVSFTPEEMAGGTAFYNYRLQDPHMADREGLSVFCTDGDSIFHTYSAYARGIDMINGAYQILDLVPKGRDEAGHDGPQFWVRRHDEYDL
jgi:predicted dithiol-disulfide oxidoreductase (DUF899 family)